MGTGGWGTVAGGSPKTLVVAPEPVGTRCDRISDAAATFARLELSRASSSSFCPWPLAHPSQTATWVSISEQPGALRLARAEETLKE